MAILIEMPKMSDTMEKGVVVAWKVKEGDRVKPGDILAEVETDKATMELEAFDTGVLRKQLIAQGEGVPVGAPIAILGAADEDISELLAKSSGAPAAAAHGKKPSKAATPRPAKSSAQPTPSAAAPSPAPEVPPAAPPATPPAAPSATSSAPPVSSAPSGSPTSTSAPSAAAPLVRPALAGADQPTLKLQASPASASPAPSAAVSAPPAPHSTGRIITSPLAARLAREKGVDLAQIRGTGPSGRIVKRDIERAAAGIPTAGLHARLGPPPGAAEPRSPYPAAPPAPFSSPSPSPFSSPFSPPPSSAPAPSSPPSPRISSFSAIPGPAGAPLLAAYEDVPLSSMRQVIASRLTLSKTTIPHYYVSMEASADALVETRRSLNEMRGEAAAPISLNDIIIKAAAVALRRHPMLNASFQGHAIRKFKNIDIGVAVSLEDGLITPVIRRADQKGLEAISGEVRELAARARQKKLKPEEYTGATFTISNLGMFGVKWFEAIINPPEAAILAVGAVEKKPVVRGDLVVPGQVLSLTLSLDHRVVDGAAGAAFLRDLRTILERPGALAL